MKFPDQIWLWAFGLAVVIAPYLIFELALIVWDEMLSFGNDGTTRAKLKVLKRKQRINIVIISIFGTAAAAAAFYWVRSIGIVFSVIALTGVCLFVVCHTTKKHAQALSRKASAPVQ